MTIKEEKSNQVGEKQHVVVSEKRKKVRQPNLISTHENNDPLRNNLKGEDTKDSIFEIIKRK